MTAATQDHEVACITTNHSSPLIRSSCNFHTRIQVRIPARTVAWGANCNFHIRTAANSSFYNSCTVSHPRTVAALTYGDFVSL